MFSERTRYDVTPNALARALAAKRARGEAVLDLTTSNPTTAKIPYDHDAILAALGDARALAYDPASFGLLAPRAEVARILAISPERVVLTASTSEAYAFLFKVLADPGDDVLVPQPSYPLFEHLAAFESVRLVPYRL